MNEGPTERFREDVPPPRPQERPTTALPFVVGSAALALYLSLPSLRHNFDGVACAIAVELGDLRHLAHGNHLAYGLLGLLFHRIANGLGPALSAIWSLQLMDSLLGALSAGLFARLVLRRGRPAGVAAAAGLGLAVSYGWWLRSVDAQVYLLAAPFLVLAFEETLSETPRPLRLAAWHTAAMLAHGAHACFAPVAIWALLNSKRPAGDRALSRGSAASQAVEAAEARADLGRYLAFCFFAVLAAYAAALTLWVRPASLDELGVWLGGSAAVGSGRHLKLLHADSLGSALAWWGSAALRVASVKPLLGLPLWGLAAWGWLKSGASSRERVIAPLWLASYAPLLLAYEPWNPDYRIMELLPLWLLAAAAFSTRDLALYAALLGAGNAFWGILPVSRLAENRPLVKAQWLGKALPEEAWVCARSIEEVYVPYFAHRRTINLRWHEGDAPGLRRRLSGLLEKGEPVFVTSDHLAAGWEEAFAAFRLEPAGTWEGVALYSVKGKPNGSL